MCGRFGSSFGAQDLAKTYDLISQPDFEIKSNSDIRPSQLIVTLTKNSPLVARQMRWGFIPTWADPSKTKIKPINARSDKLGGNFYRSDFESNRCLIPASFFYEWKKEKIEGKLVKTPFRFKIKDTNIFSFAGIYSSHQDAEGKIHYMTAIITTSANSLMKKVHDRMPVIIDINDTAKYFESLQKAKMLLKPYDEERMECEEVNTV
ncbi:SOS response-associated peptidase [Candidatus Woesebacteria bacterium]|nr:MAG: SOS response-associated peptidase [Candidatus Woesebacteria bacterium]